MPKRLAVLVGLASVSMAGAEMQRALLTHENKYPELHQLEIGALGSAEDFDSGDVRSVGPFVRFGLLENLTFSATAPYMEISPDFGKDESGIGDTVLGLDLLAYQDIFGYPYVIPHVSVSLDTGDEDKGLGRGDTFTTVGVSIGTVTHEVLHWIADFSYVINGGEKGSDTDNYYELAGSLIWDVSKRFAVLVEGMLSEQEEADGDHLNFVQGGFTYKWTDDLVMGAYFGSTTSDDSDSNGRVTVKASYSF